MSSFFSIISALKSTATQVFPVTPRPSNNFYISHFSFFMSGKLFLTTSVAIIAFQTPVSWFIWQLNLHATSIIMLRQIIKLYRVWNLTTIHMSELSWIGRHARYASRKSSESFQTHLTWGRISNPAVYFANKNFGYPLSPTEKNAQT